MLSGTNVPLLNVDSFPRISKLSISLSKDTKDGNSL